MIAIPDPVSSKILSAVRRVWEDSGIEQPKVGIVPLYALVGAYPIRVAEVPGLTYRSAASFLAAETGQQVPLPINEDVRLSGFLYAYKYGSSIYGCILVEKSDLIPRRRFSIAHELGHYAMHLLPQLSIIEANEGIEDLVMSEGLSYGDQTNEADDIPSGQLSYELSAELLPQPLIIDGDECEKEANQFAAEILMPASACIELINRYSQPFSGLRDFLSKRLASEFLCSKEAMTWRLSSLGI